MGLGVFRKAVCSSLFSRYSFAAVFGAWAATLGCCVAVLAVTAVRACDVFPRPIPMLLVTGVTHFLPSVRQAVSTVTREDRTIHPQNHGGSDADLRQRFAM